MRKAFVSIISTILVLLLVPVGHWQLGVAQAAEKFSLEHDAAYEIKPDAATTVTQSVTITNQESDVIATNYALMVRYQDTFNEKASENEENMSIKKELTENGTKLTAIFNKVAIGKGATKNFTVSYDTNEIVHKIGDVWYVNIPKSEITQATTLYNIQLVIPNELGNKLFMSPQPQLFKDAQNNTTTYYFTKEDLLNTGITAAFGTYQTLNFKLEYQLKNEGYLNAIYEIALPSDIEGYQQVSFREIEPEPKKIYLDKDENVIAQYKLDGKSKLNVSVLGTAKVITKQIQIENGGYFLDVPKSLVTKYTKKDTYWETDSKLIESLKDTLYEDGESVTKNAYNIYKFLVDNFKYDNDVLSKPYIDRKGALSALSTKEPIACMEFTDIFIALARSMRIPAREINGYAIATGTSVDTPSSINIKGGDLLHAWPEFYDPNFGWVQIDPTWGNTSKIDYFTKLDTNHFAFVRRGINSEYPLPAGMHRQNDNTKLINIDFSNTANAAVFESKLNTKKIFNFSLVHWILGYSRYEIENTGSVFVYGINGGYLAPNQKMRVFIKKNVQEVKYADFNGSEHALGLE